MVSTIYDEHAPTVDVKKTLEYCLRDPSLKEHNLTTSTTVHIHDNILSLPNSNASYEVHIPDGKIPFLQELLGPDTVIDFGRNYDLQIGVQSHEGTMRIFPTKNLKQSVNGDYQVVLGAVDSPWGLLLRKKSHLPRMHHYLTMFEPAN